MVTTIGDIVFIDLSNDSQDFVAAYVFGLKHSCNFVTDISTGVKFFEDFKSRQKYTFWPQELPNFTRWMTALKLKWMMIPRWVDERSSGIEDWVLDMCNRADASLQQGGQLEPEDTPTVSCNPCILRSILK